MMKWSLRSKNILTAGYLIFAFTVTAATSKTSDNATAVAVPLAVAVSGITNYSVQTNCSSLTIQNLVAIRSEGGQITQFLTSDGTLNTTTPIDYTQFGFPQARITVGVDQYGAGASANQKCIAGTKQSQVNSKSNLSTPAYWFIQDGYLTSVPYDCSSSNAYVCSTTLSELPAGDLKNAFQN